MTTIETLTDTQIETLYREASAAGDAEQCMICDVALGNVRDWSIESFAPVSEEDARARIVRAIQHAEAQRCALI